MSEPRRYGMKPSGREELSPSPEPTLEQRVAWQAQRIGAIERIIARLEAQAREYEEIYASAIRQYVDGYREEAAKFKGRLADAEAGLLELLKMLPEKARRYRHGRTTFGVTPAKKSVEILDEDKAVEEVKALGARGADLIRTKESVKKEEMLEFIERGDSPGFEHIKVNTGMDSLRRSYQK